MNSSTWNLFQRIEVSRYNDVNVGHRLAMGFNYLASAAASRSL